MLAWRNLAMCVAWFCAIGQGAGLETIHSQRLNLDVPVVVHLPSSQAVAHWTSAHPGSPMRLVLFLPGAYDKPADFIKEGLEAFLSEQEVEGTIPPSLWVAVPHFKSWYADRADGSFPYERFLVEELIPGLEARHPGFGGEPRARSVAGFSMGGFGALNLAGRTGAFSKCLALSPALVEPPFKQAGWLLRRSLKATFPLDPGRFAPWNPWKHLGGSTDLVVGCGTQDKYGLAETCRAFTRVCQEKHRPLRLDLRPGGHNWTYWTAAIKQWTPWLLGADTPGGIAPEPVPVPVAGFGPMLFR